MSPSPMLGVDDDVDVAEVDVVLLRHLDGAHADHVARLVPGDKRLDRQVRRVLEELGPLLASRVGPVPLLGVPSRYTAW